MKTSWKTKQKPVSGQRLFAKIWQGRSRPYAKMWLTVSSVGRKFFECVDAESGGRPRKFLIDDWRLADLNENVNSPVYLYLSEEDCRDAEHAEGLAFGLSMRIRHMNDWQKLSLSQLDRITSILNEPPTR